MVVEWVVKGRIGDGGEGGGGEMGWGEVGRWGDGDVVGQAGQAVKTRFCGVAEWFIDHDI